MTTAELLAAAEEAAPELMQKTAEMLDLLEALSPRHEMEVRRDMAEIATYTNTKLAAATGYGPLARFGAAVGGTLAAGLATSVATDLYDVAKRGLTKGRNFKRMMKANPDMSGIEKERLHNAFDAVHRYAPEFTADPILSGTLVGAVAKVPGNEHTVIKDLINARKNLQDAKHTQFRPGTTTIDLPDSADVAADAARRAHDLEMAARREGHDLKMFAAKSRLDRTREVRQYGHDKDMAEIDERAKRGLERMKDDLKRQYNDDEVNNQSLRPMYPRKYALP